MRRTYARIALSPLRLRRPAALPERRVERTVTADRGRLADYDRVCGFRLRDELPATFVHVLAFPLGLELMAGRDFPFGPLGLVHVANRIEVAAALRAGEPIALSVRAADLRAHARGRQFDVVAEARAGGEIAWRGVSTYLHREATPEGSDPQRSADREGSSGPIAAGAADRDGPSGPIAAGGAAPVDRPAPTAIWGVPADIGRRYARVSGDRNPIHLHHLTARAFGQPTAIAHGMWTKARCLAALEGALPDAYTIDVRFKLPLRLPGRVAFRFRDGDLGVHDARSGRPHLTGSLRT